MACLKDICKNNHKLILKMLQGKEHMFSAFSTLIIKLKCPGIRAFSALIQETDESPHHWIHISRFMDPTAATKNM